MATPRTMTKPAEFKAIDALSTKLTGSANKVVTYLESKLQDDGSFGGEAKDIACYFKSPMMFLASNKPQAAKAVLKHIKTAFMTAEGDFKTSETLKSANGAYIEFWSYTNGWITRAANQLGLEEISQSANRYLKQYHLGEKSGFSTNQVNKDPKVTDVLTVAHHGLLNLEMGNLEIAISAGNYLCQAINKQPNLKNGFYLRLDNEGNLITSFPKEQTAFYFVSSTEPNQLHFMIGYPAAYLAMLYKKTKNLDFLTAAKSYLDFSLSCDKSVYACDFSHKIAWAASLVYECTGDVKYLAVIDKIADHFIAKQQKDGMWFSDDINASYDQSAEIACWFLDIVKNVNEFKKKVSLEEAKKAEPKQHKSWTKTAVTSAVIALAAGVGLAILRSKTAAPGSTTVVDTIRPLSGIR